MNIADIMDKKLYLRIRKNIVFYYWGRDCIADYDYSTVAILQEPDIFILQNIDGRRTMEDLLLCMKQSKCFIDLDEIQNRIFKLIELGILIARDTPTVTTAEFRGERGKFYPKDLLIELTNNCNFSCSFCYKNAGHGGEFIKDETIEELCTIMDGKIPEILLTGGEPTLHPHLMQYIKLLSGYANVRMNTNGSILYKLDRQILSLLKHIQITLYGVNNEEYERTTGIHNGFEKIKKSISFLNDNEIPYLIAVTLNRDNIEYMEEYVLAAIELGAKTLKIGHVDEFGREALRPPRGKEYLNQIENIDKRIRRLKVKYSSKIRIVVNYANYNLFRVDPKFFAPFLECGSGFERFVISQKGNVRACECFPENFFDMGGVEFLANFINGNMRLKEFSNRVQLFHDNCSGKNGNGLPCEALRQYYARQHKVVEQETEMNHV